MGKLVLGYWKIRGLAEPARLLLEYTGTDYEDKKYECTDGPEFDRSCWTDVKFTFGMDFPNLPYIIDGDFKITESWAIYRYIASKNNLIPSDCQTAARCAMLEGVISTFRGGFTSMCYNPNFNDLKDSFIEKNTLKLQQFNAYLDGKSYFAGDKVCYVDFPFFEICDQMRVLYPNIFDKYANIKAFMDRFESLEKIAEYRKSQRFSKFPMNNKMAKWGGSAQG